MEKSETVKKKTMLLAITGSIGAVSLPSYVPALISQLYCNIDIIMSQAATRFVSPYTLELLTRRKVFVDMFDESETIKVPHIELTKRSDLFVIMPATANIIGKAANGICDDLISLCIIASSKPVVFVPNMNENMWENKAVKTNIMKLKENGHNVIEPGVGIEVSSGKRTRGSMPGIKEMIDFLKKMLED